MNLGSFILILLLVCTMFERRLLQEKKRLSSSFPPSPYPDQDECERLIEAHQHWVLNGDELKPDDIDDDSETTYPLQHNAYKRRDVTPSDTAAGDDTADDDDAAATGAAAQADFRPVTPPCDTSLLCSVCEQNPVDGDVSISCDDGGLMCACCKRDEQATLALLSTAPDVPRTEQAPADDVNQPSTSSVAAAAAGSSHREPEAMDTLDEAANDAYQRLVDDMFASSAGADCADKHVCDARNHVTQSTQHKLTHMQRNDPVISICFPSSDDMAESPDIATVACSLDDVSLESTSAAGLAQQQQLEMIVRQPRENKL